MITTYFVYVLESINRNYIYVGMTNCIKRRVKQHQIGKEQTTAPYRPFRLVIIEKFHTRSNARVREKYLKSGAGKEWIKKHLKK